MNTDIKLLIIEDAYEIVTLYQDYVATHNLDGDVKISVVTCKDVEMAKSVLISNGGDFDCAIVDLRLGQNDEGSGNQVIKQILDTSRIPIIVMSGYVQELEQTYKDNGLVRIFDKDGDLEIVFNYIIDLYKTGITKILGKKGLIDQYLDKVFWEYIWKDTHHWFGMGTQKQIDTEKVLLRYTLSHLQEYLGLTEAQDKFENYLPVEMYIIPPIKKKLFTGGILGSVKDGKKYIILSPSCDMAQDKGNWVVIAEIESLEQDSLYSDMKSRKASIKEFKKLAKNNHSNKYHFLPKTHLFDGGLINFQKIRSVEYSFLDDRKEYDFIGCVAEVFTRDITSRFSQYYARQGQPDFDNDILESTFN